MVIQFLFQNMIFPDIALFILQASAFQTSYHRFLCVIYL
jgi:hypothetical protein